ncbi:aminotransferase class IV [Leucobacter salsicius]|uniref:aminotransferase class IV n=1 Tax=Leucobacter salsicius TaxID=664638 RepID=UPI000345B7BF|nr:aminotransferase class IV [Leucobacter salsicius]
MGLTDTPSPERTLLVADSFRVRAHDGVAEVRGLAHHLARFRGSALAAASASPDSRPTPQEVDDFSASALPRIAAAGAGFPRLELWRDTGGAMLSLALRPSPPLRHEISLTSAVRPFGQPTPQTKGPNISAYAELAHRLGGEVLLLDDAGRAVEGTTTSLIWWKADGTGWYAASQDRVSSITELLMRNIAQDIGVALCPESRTPAELAKLEVWAVNALHGIRPVVSIDGLESARPDPDRLAQYRAALDREWGAVFP